MKTNTFACDQCGRSEITMERPREWRSVTLYSVDGDNVGSYDGDMCSPKCAAAWIAERFEGDLKL